MAKKNDIIDVTPIEHVKKPWGHYENVRSFGQHAKLKILTVEPGHRMSYQSHEHRDEIWIPVQGCGLAFISNDEEEGDVAQAFLLAPGTGITEIAAGQKHQIDNRGGEEPLVIVEVQLGDRCEEDDITRYSDDYGRADEQE